MNKLINYPYTGPVPFITTIIVLSVFFSVSMGVWVILIDVKLQILNMQSSLENEIRRQLHTAEVRTWNNWQKEGNM